MENTAPSAVNDVKTVNAGFNGESTYWFGLDFYKLITNDSDAEGDAISITSVDGQALVDGTVTVTGSNGGTFTVLADGTVYLDASTGFETLAVGETLDTAVTYTVTDANGASSTATYTVTINGMNDAVKANVDAVSVAENAPLALNILDNDTAFDGDKAVSAVDGDALNLGVAVAGDNGGAFTINADGSTTFVQGTDFDYLAEGQTVVSSVAYTIAGYNGENSTSTVAVTVTGINDAPNAVNDVKTVNAGFNGESTYWFGLDFYKLITNDSDAEGDAISITSVDGQALVDGTVTVTGSNGGTFTVSADGTVNLDVSTGFETLAVGETLDTAITYTVSDANGASTTATYTVTINGMNDAVVANVDEYSTTEDEAITGNVLENEDSTAYIIDVDGLFENIGQAIFGDNGGVFVIDEDGSFSFEPQDDFAHLTIGEYEVTTINITIGGNFTPWSFAVSITIYGNFDTNQDEVTMGNILTNDFSFDGDKTVTKINDLDTNVGQEVVGDNGGTFLIEADGTSTFDPNDEFNYLAEGETTTTSIGYTIEGYNGEYSTSTVTVTVTGINDAPNAVNDVKTVNAGFNGESTYWFGLDFYKLITNDSDAEGDAISITSVDGQALVDGTVTVTGSNGGTFTVLADGTVYLDASTGFETLAVGETLDTAVTYTVTDANGASSTATYTVTINGMNDAVKANVDAVSVAENAPLALNILDNDTAFDGDKAVSAVDGDALNLGVAVAGDNGGAFTINADGSTTFVQGTDFDYLAEGQTVVSSVAYTIAGYNGENSTSTVAVTVTGINDAPNAVNDVKTVNAGFNGESTYWFGLDFYKLITNDSDAEGDAISITAVDGQALVDGTVTVTGSNGGTFTVSADGTVYLDASTGFETLAVGETLDTAVTYTVTDANGASTTATYTVTINGMNDAVKANVDAVSVAENAPLALNVLDNDTAFDGDKSVSAVDGDALNIGAAVAGDNGGAFTINADGSTTFVQGTDFDYLAEGQTVVSSVAYTIAGYNGENSTSTVAVTVTGINDAPNAVDDIKTVNAGFNGESTYWFGLDFYKLITNDSDAEGDAISITSVDGQALVDGTVTVTGSNGGTFTVLADGTVNLDASTGFETLAVGETLDTAVTYTVSDANGASTTATYTVTVNGMNDAVKANVDAASVAENAPLALNVLDNDTAFDGNKVVSAVDGDALNLGAAVGGDNGGAFTINADGSTTFEQGTDFDYLAEGQTVVTSVAYTTEGYNGENSSSTVAITVTGINDAPNAVNDIKTVNAGFNGESTYWFGTNFNKLITNDSDAEGDAISISAVDGQALVDGSVTVTGSNGGVFTISADGTVHLDASTDFETVPEGQAVETSIDYTVDDGNGGTDVATYTVTVQGDYMGS